MCPLFDFNGQLCGCLHLINKLDPETLPEKDEQDLQRISASIAELIHLLEVQSKVTDIAANLNKVMGTIQGEVSEFNDQYYKNLHMTDIKDQLSKIDENAKHMTRKKREMSFEEGSVAD